MFKALGYKEWMKVRGAVLIIAIAFLLVFINTALTLSYIMRTGDPNLYWNNLIFRMSLYYSLLKYLPLIAGIIIAFTQFFPEISENRLKLTLHLPLNEKTIILDMVAYGTLMLVVLFLFTIFLFATIILYFFPIEFLYSFLITTAPWFLAGLTVYWLSAAIFVEPIWLYRRVFLIVITLAYIMLLYAQKGYNNFAVSIHWFTLLSASLSISILVSTVRFKKGVI